MAAGLFYYSPDGAQALGPVGVEELRRLAREGVLRKGSLICPAGAEEWRPFDPATLPTSSRDALVHSRTARRPQIEHAPPDESGILAQILNLVTALAAGGSVVASLAIMGHHAEEQGTEINGWYVLGGSVLIFAAIPWGISKLFHGWIRLIVRAVLACALASALPFVAYFMGLVPLGAGR